MRKKPRPPLPRRHGLDPVRLRTPTSGEWPTFREYLLDRLPRVTVRRLDAMLDAGEFVTTTGPIGQETPFAPGIPLWFHRDPPDEVAVPFDIGIVHRDPALIVVDKPHFLATMPRGRHILQTALIRLRRELDVPDLCPVHRLDRATAGLLMFTTRPEYRGAYQSLFQHRRVHKEYEAVASVRPDLTLPRTVRSRIIKESGQLTAQELPGTPNAETYIELVDRREELGRYQLVPRTGRTHQLRVHLSRLGIPILGDDRYPEPRLRADDDFCRPLQLLARALEFTDPLTGQQRRFDSALDLRAWVDYPAWADRPPDTREVTDTAADVHARL